MAGLLGLAFLRSCGLQVSAAQMEVVQAGLAGPGQNGRCSVVPEDP